MGAGRALLVGVLAAGVLVATAPGGGGPPGKDVWIQVAAAAQEPPEPPTMSAAERMQLAFAGFAADGERLRGFPNRMQGTGAWPPMRWIGDSAEIAGKTFTVRDARLVAGSGRPMAYEPATGRMRPAPEGLRTNLFDFSRNTEVFIPPNSTLVMIQVDVEPEAVGKPMGEAGCDTRGERDFGNMLRLSDKAQGEGSVIRTSSDENLAPFSSPIIYCLSSGWLYFHVGRLGADPGKLWFEIVDEEIEGELAIWTLIPPTLDR